MNTVVVDGARKAFYLLILLILNYIKRYKARTLYFMVECKVALIL